MTRQFSRSKQTSPKSSSKASSKSKRALTKAGAKIVEQRLDNGMRVLLLERHDAPVVSVIVYYKVGARNEREHEAGVSHFLEHMMFKGTPKLGKGQIDLITTMLGGNNNAWTAHDHTAYWFEFASDRWERALEIEADRMQGLLLQEDEFEAEKAVVLEELSMNEDDPWRELSREVGETLFQGHAYGRPVIGYAETLRAMSAADMRDFYDRYYRPGNATLVICGDIDPNEALELVHKHFDGVTKGPVDAAAEPFRRPPVEPRSEKRLTCRWDDEARRLCMAWPTAKFCSEEDYALDLLTVVLASGRHSRLYSRIVQEEGLATSLSMSNDTRVEGGALWLMAECAEKTTPLELEAAIDEELERVSTELISAKEMKRARAMLYASEAFESETVTDLAEDIGSFAVDGDWRLALQNQERLEAIRPSFVRDVARRFVTPARRVVGWSLPQDPSAKAARTLRRS